MSSLNLHSKRIKKDIIKLFDESKNEGDVTINCDNNLNDLNVKLYGPKDSYYANGVWKVFVSIPSNYPEFKPKIQFCNRIFHPNITEITGRVCIDVLSARWNPNIDLYQLIHYYLPGLLTKPNPFDFVNREAATLMKTNMESFQEKVSEYIQNYATEEVVIRDFGYRFYRPTPLPLDD